MVAASEQVKKFKAKKMPLNFTIVDKGKTINQCSILFSKRKKIKSNAKKNNAPFYFARIDL